jgi:hypothetical protein
MPVLYSFIGCDLENILSNRELFLPGVIKMEGIYYSSEDGDLKYLSINKDGTAQTIDDLNVQKTEFYVSSQKLRNRDAHFAWMQKDELPYGIRSGRNLNPTLFSESDRVVLMLRYRNTYDNLFDLLFIHFNLNLSNFGISLVDKDLTADNKSIIGHIFYHYFNSIIMLNRQNLNVLKSLNENTKALIRNNAVLSEELDKSKQTFSEGILNLCDRYLNVISQQRERKYLLAEDAVEKLKTYQGNISHLETIINDAVIFYENLNYDRLQDIIILHSFHINLADRQVDELIPSEGVKKIDSRESKTIMLLDKLEKAASLTKNRHLPLTGINVGNSCPIPISAPAITDALKKHRKMIISLFSKYPDRWGLIRSEFRPVKNLASARDFPEQKDKIA